MKRAGLLLSAALAALPVLAKKAPPPPLALALETAGAPKFGRVQTIQATWASAAKGQPRRLVRLSGQRTDAGWRLREDSENLTVVWNGSASWALRGGARVPAADAAKLARETQERVFWLLAPQGLNPASEKYLGLGYFQDRLVKRVEAAAPDAYDTPVTVAIDSGTYVLRGAETPDNTRWVVGDQQLVQNIALVPFFLARIGPEGPQESLVVREFTFNGFVDESVFDLSQSTGTADGPKK